MQTPVTYFLVILKYLTQETHKIYAKVHTHGISRDMINFHVIELLFLNPYYTGTIIPWLSLSNQYFIAIQAHQT